MLGKHFANRHAGIAVLYKCRKCDKTNVNSHSISCHIPKCKGTGRERVDSMEFTCELCGQGYRTGVGLTQHKRHNHPAELNRERIERRGAVTREAKSTKLWSDEEVATVIRLALKHEGKPKINALIAEELGTGKTAEQVRSKRRLLLAAQARHGPDNGGGSRNAPEAPEAPIVLQPPPHVAHSRLRDALGRGEVQEGENEIRVMAELVRGMDQNPGLIESSALELIRRLGKEGSPTSETGPRTEPSNEGMGEEALPKEAQLQGAPAVVPKGPGEAGDLGSGWSG